MSNAADFQCLYPAGIASTPMRGRYLAENIHKEGCEETPFIFGNYVSSIDGRIATPGTNTHWATPTHLTTPSDWLLFKELQTQAECLITHSGYLRALADGTQGNILQIPSSEDDQYLSNWREQNGLAAQPHILIVSRTLDFPWPETLDTQHQPVSVLTSVTRDHPALALLEARGVATFISETEGWVTADDVYRVLQQRRLRTAYLQTGPELLQSMLTFNLLRRLYLTLNLSLVGGADFLSMLSGNIPLDRKSMRLRSLYLRNTTDSSGLDDIREDAQLFAAFDL